MALADAIGWDEQVGLYVGYALATFAAAALTYGGIGFACTLVMLIVWRRHLWSADAPANR